MPLEIGTELGPYAILGILGKGGMGEVYRARDSRLGRDVAIKISAERFTQTFEREARAIAALNHPNICQVYDVGPNYLVMELVEGEAPKGPLPLEEVLNIAGQIADALQEAHEKHITHRDLKPGNIKITPDGKVKILDFGLAKLGGPSQAVRTEDSPTISMAATQAGMIVGTAAYMSPEQARGKLVDSRADIWAFGVVIYELLTGKRLFEGEDLTETLASVVKEHPSLDAVPIRVRRLLESCLQKDPRKRLQSIGDMRLLVDGVHETVTSPQSRARWLWQALATFAIAGLAVLALVHFREPARESPALHLSIPLPERVNQFSYVKVSPDGSRVAALFVRDNQSGLWVRPLDGTEWKRIDSTLNARTPFWSADSRFIGFFADGKLKTVSATGGPAKELCPGTGLGRGGAWNTNGDILFGSETGPMRRVSSNGGPCVEVLREKAKLRTGFPEFMPDGKHFIYSGDDVARGVFTASLEDVPQDELVGKKVLEDRSSAIYTESAGLKGGHLLFVRAGILMAVRFDPARMQPDGDPFAVADHASFTLTPPEIAASVAKNGTVVYIANSTPSFQAEWTDRTGKQRSQIDIPGDSRGVALSPNGRQATVNRRSGGIHLYDLDRNSEVQLTVAATSGTGIWSEDGTQIAFAATIDGVSGIYRKAANGSGKEELWVATPENVPRLAQWTRDFLIYTIVDPSTRGDVWYLPNPGKADSKPVKFIAGSASESYGQLSPDGHWLAYISNETGRNQVYVRQFPEGGGFARISVDGGSEPRWSRTGSELYFTRAGERDRDRQLMAVAIHVDARGELHAGNPATLFNFSTLTYVLENNMWTYDPHPDGNRFFLATQAAGATPTLNVITNWGKFAKN
jgi:serine/threonine protein kinase/Tol biopolymer transport system component